MATSTRNAGAESVVVEGEGFQGGVNVRDAITQLNPSECRKLENGVLDERGGFSKRLGSLNKGTFGVAADRVLAMYTFYRAGLVPQILIQTTAGQLFYTNDPTAQPIVWTQIATGLFTSAPMSFETFNNKVYMSNGVDAYCSWDGTTYVTFASAPKGKYLRLWKDTMWVSGITGTPDRVYSSNAGDPETFGVSGWVDISKGDGDRIMALATDGLYLIVGKRNRAMTIYDPTTFANRVVDFEKGFESHSSVAQFEGAIYYLSRRGICMWLGDTPSKIVSGKIDSIFDPGVLNLTAEAMGRAWAYTYENRIGWALTELGSAVPSFQLEYYPRLIGKDNQAPFAFQRIPATTFTRWRYMTDDILFAGHVSANKVLHTFASVGTDDGVVFAALAETGALDFNRPTIYKYLRRMRMLGRGQFTMQMRRNFRVDTYKTFLLDMSSGSDLWSTGDSWGAGTWGPELLLKEQKLHPDAYVRFLTLVFTDSDSDIGSKPVPIGSKDNRIIAGEWAIYNYNIDATLLGVRD